MLIAALLLATPALNAQGRQRRPAQGESQGGDRGAQPRTAVPRGEATRESSPPPPAAAPAPPPRSTSREGDGQRRRSGDGGQRRADGGDGEAQAVPRGSRPRGDNPETGVAVPRGSRPPRDGGSGTVYRPRRNGSNNNYYYYPRRYYPYGYGTFGLGYFYYDPYGWDPYYAGGYGGRFSGYGYGYPTGELRLQVDQREAEVYVDGYYAGNVDDFDGVFQSLALEEGQYQIEVVAPGFEPLTFGVRIFPGRKVTYRGELLPQRP
jgi:hypothetical protein